MCDTFSTVITRDIGDAMKVAIMQPYFFPYLGYFQLVAAVNTFVVWDDVQYIQRGWVNRNRILLNSEPTYITLPVEKAAQTAYINERQVTDLAAATPKILGQIHAAYRKAPYYAETRDLVEKILTLPERNLGRYLFQGLQLICQYMELETVLLLSSELQKDDEGLSSTQRILEICKTQNADMYVNAIGGRHLYQAEDFSAQGMELRFIAMEDIHYDQSVTPFVPYLSIIDVLMFNNKAMLQAMLQRYSLQR